MKLYSTSRISRRLGERLFLKAERDATPKSAMVRRAYPPGMHGKRRSRGLSDFGVALKEKQKIQYLYGLSNSGLKRLVAEAAAKRGKSSIQALIEILELRLDNAVYRLGLAASRRIARQVISHGHIMVNGRRTRIPSFRLRTGSAIGIRPESRAQPLFSAIPTRLKKYSPPAWLSLDAEEFAGTVTRLPTEDDAMISQDISKLIGFYSR